MAENGSLGRKSGHKREMLHMSNRPKIIYLSKKVQKYSMRNPISPRLDYDRSQCAESSYFKGAGNVCFHRLSTKLDCLAKLHRQGQ